MYCNCLSFRNQLFLKYIFFQLAHSKIIGILNLHAAKFNKERANRTLDFPIFSCHFVKLQLYIYDRISLSLYMLYVLNG